MSTKSGTLKRSKTIKSLEDLALRKFLKRFLVTVGYETFHKKNEELYDFLEPVRLYLHRTNKFSLAKKWILELMFENGSWISVRQAKKNWTNGHFIEYWLWYYFAHIHTSELVLPDVLTCGTNLAKSSAKVNVLQCGNFRIFSVTLILREINFWYSRSVKYVILPHLEALNLEFH